VRDIHNNFLQPHPFGFKIETAAQNAASGQNLPQTDDYYIDDPYSGDPYDAVIEIIDGALSGAKVVYSSREPHTPAFGPSDGIEEINLAGIRAAGLPLNLTPHTVFDNPVKLFIPVVDDVDYHFSGVQAVIGGSGTTEEEEKPPGHDGSGVTVYASCFINTVAGDADFEIFELIGFLAFIGVLLYLTPVPCGRSRHRGRWVFLLTADERRHPQTF
jgi:hypothetical protein